MKVWRLRVWDLDNEIVNERMFTDEAKARKALKEYNLTQEDEYEIEPIEVE